MLSGTVGQPEFSEVPALSNLEVATKAEAPRAAAKTALPIIPVEPKRASFMEMPRDLDRRRFRHANMYTSYTFYSVFTLST